MKKSALLWPVALLALAGWAASISGCQTHPPRAASPTVIPRIWDDAARAGMELPLVNPAASPLYPPANYYYRIPERRIYKTYPIYHPDKEPKGYTNWLAQQEPREILIDPATLKTEADWIHAGKTVFEAPMFFGGPLGYTLEDIRNSAWYGPGTPGERLTKDHVMPWMVYVVRKKGVVELGSLSCANCHIRIMPDRTVIHGAQGNFPFEAANAFDFRAGRQGVVPAAHEADRFLFAAPWIKPNPLAALETMSLEDMARHRDVIPPGVIARIGTSFFSPVHVPDLIGVQGRRYFDSTGLVRHRSVEDLMRYATINALIEVLASFDGFIPKGVFLPGGKLPADPKESDIDRHSDAQLYALAKYVYSLKPPKNPNLPKTTEQKARVKHGEAIFKEEGCARCHDPKQGYTNNKLIAAPGFDVPNDHPAKDDIMRNASGTPRRIGSDPTLTLTTRRGTGFYKVPSLLGVWYRGPFEHNGSVATLEDWFNPARTNDTYIPTGWKGPPGTKTRAVKGHEFGLDFSEDDREAMIAFLKTL